MERKIISAEVCRKLLALNGHCVQLLAQTYPTKGAHTLIRLLQKIVAAMQERFDSYNKKQIVLVGSLCRRFEQYIGYVDSSKMYQVPWSILPALEKLFQNIRPKCQFIICPIWQTNYAIYNSNLLQEIKTKIIEVPGLLFDHDDSFINKVESFVADMPAGLYFLFYPRLERLSVLHFSLLGHEIGHIIADEWLQKKWEEFLAQFEIEKTLSKHFEKRFDARFEVFKQPVIKRQVAEAIEHFEKILKELLSDIFGGLIFGPPSLFSYYVFALNSQLDDLRGITNGYLPWRYRLRFLRDVLFKIGEKHLELIAKEPVSAGTWLQTIRDVCEAKPELVALEGDNVLSHFMILLRAIDKAQEEIYSEMIKLSGDQCYIKTFSQEAYQEVLERLENGITPNATIRENLVEQPIDVRNIVLGTWAFVTSISIDDYKEYTEKARIANLLSLKAIELSTLQEDFNDSN